MRIDVSQHTEEHTETASEEGLGPCAAPWCNRDAVVYVSASTYGPSPRLLVVGGVRAAELARVDPLAVRCLDCTSWALDAVVTPRLRPSDG